MIRAWRSLDRFEGRAALRSWLYRIATNVCFDMLNGRSRRARPMDLGASRAPDGGESQDPARGHLDRADPDATWSAGGRPAEGRRRARDDQAWRSWPRSSTCPPRQRAVLILCEVCAGRPARPPSCSRPASPRSTARCSAPARRSRPVSCTTPTTPPRSSGRPRAARPLRQGVRGLRHGGADLADPRGRDPVDAAVRAVAHRPRRHLRLVGRAAGSAAAGSRVHPDLAANGSPAFGQYKPSETGSGLRPVGAAGARDRGRQDRRAHVLPGHGDVFPLFGLPPRLDGLDGSVRQHVAQAEEARPGRAAPAAPRSRTWQPARQAASCSRASASTVTASAATPLTSHRATSRGVRRTARTRDRTVRAGLSARSGRGSRT